MLATKQCGKDPKAGRHGSKVYILLMAGRSRSSTGRLWRSLPYAHNCFSEVNLAKPGGKLCKRLSATLRVSNA